MRIKLKVAQAVWSVLIGFPLRVRVYYTIYYMVKG